MTVSDFATAEDAQKAFYAAIERADLTQMMAVWCEDEDVVCIHPGGARHSGIGAVRESWRQIFQHGPQLKFSLIGDRTHRGRMLSIHSVNEQITHSAAAHPPANVIATNIFVRSADGWRMLMHHASLVPEVTLQESSSPSVLH